MALWKTTTKKGLVKETCLIEYFKVAHFMKHTEKENPPQKIAFHETQAKK